MRSDDNNSEGDGAEGASFYLGQSRDELSAACQVAVMKCRQILDTIRPKR
jgi:hypothetical protein